MISFKMKERNEEEEERREISFISYIEKRNESHLMYI